MLYPAHAGGKASYKRLRYSRSMSAILECQEYRSGENGPIDAGLPTQPMFKMPIRTRARQYPSSDPVVFWDFCMGVKKRSSTLVLGLVLVLAWSLCMSNMFLRLQYSSTHRGMWLRSSSGDHHHQQPLGPLSVASPLIRTVSHSIPLPLPKVSSHFCTQSPLWRGIRNLVSLFCFVRTQTTKGKSIGCVNEFQPTSNDSGLYLDEDAPVSSQCR